MDKNQVFEQIKKDYPEARWMSSTCIQVSFLDLLLDPYNYGFVSVVFLPDKIMLTDFANNEEIFEFSKEKYQEFCNKHGLVWDDYHIECEYHDNSDIKRYKDCLIDMAEYNWKIKNY